MRLKIGGLDIKALLPQHKSDSESVEKLRTLSFEQIEPIIPDLLEWLQDINWPIAGAVADVLTPFVGKIVPDIIRVLKSSDEEWKYWILKTLAQTATDPSLLKEIGRIATHPTKGEIASEANIEAAHILRSRSQSL